MLSSLLIQACLRRMGKAFVDCIIGPLIRLTDPIPQSSGMLFDQINTAVGRPSVDVTYSQLGVSL